MKDIDKELQNRPEEEGGLLCTGEDQEILQKIENRPQLLNQIIAKHHMRPLPAPEDMARYSNIIPNGAERIMQMAEKEQTARLQMEDKEQRERFNFLKQEQEIKKRGQLFGCLSVIVFAAISFYLIYSGSPTAGASLMGASLVAVVLAFVAGRSNTKE
ncbi:MULTISPECIES: DUF2335 domain-containing protein [unclassified Neisseria]|uniref:DUF2335 domain-containing protein n=1 Tax=unclassified Neisseria TaxID=2623750 RepID=UPI002666986F|nr:MULTISPECIES: DUF2335 domain-containing protein [unclassified Neisseria]MDO1509965.1 DUF2335 domain-containing protein [Neisseria sp. MVDL19-042950]MDO1516165.1 DUF2335 domain-containing protein [Neisseria sp. MVDL18-041461]MDO1563280.1 DUF2335 domain-containing protein [Neisseria sp. MVDL20-010259]